MRNIIFMLISGLLIATTGCVSTTKAHRKSSTGTGEGKQERTSSTERQVPVETMSNQEIQIALKNAGYYTGTIDGILGSRSRDAIRKFQQDHALKDDSIAGPRTQEKLGAYINTKYKP